MGVALQKNVYVVRLCHQVLRQQKYNMRQWVASIYCPIVARQLCSVQYTILQLLPYLTLPVVILFWLAGVFLAEVLKWVGTHGNAVLRTAISAIRRSEASNSVFSRGNCTFPGRKDSFMRMQFFQWTNQTEFGQDSRPIGLTRNTGARCKIKMGPQFFLQGAQ